MTDAEIKQHLVFVCESLKKQIQITGDLHHSLNALLQALFQKEPPFQQLYGQKFDWPTPEVADAMNRSTALPIRELDALIQKLKSD